MKKKSSKGKASIDPMQKPTATANANSIKKNIPMTKLKNKGGKHKA